MSFGLGINGALQGASEGVSIGSAIPGVGTTIGGIIGGGLGLLGGLFGSGNSTKKKYTIITMEKGQLLLRNLKNLLKKEMKK